MAPLTAQNIGDGTEDSSGLWRWHRGQQKMVGMAQSTSEYGEDGREDSRG